MPKATPMEHDAFFIAPDGEVITVEQKHISKICDDPVRFGYTKKRLEAVFRKHGETYGSEQFAREEIIADLLRKGWIRVRWYYSEAQLRIQIYRINASAKKRINGFLARSRNGEYGKGPSSMHLDVQVIDIGENELARTTVRSGV
ncbi:MAG: hypothetical protein AABZ39_00205 [Spirochaetota bacterium]